jgi:hypothetical protein
MRPRPRAPSQSRLAPSQRPASSRTRRAMDRWSVRRSSGRAHPRGAAAVPPVASKRARRL